jgi:nudix-type nucleoside diphosphatase (YffH/AdpP family)
MAMAEIDSKAEILAVRHVHAGWSNMMVATVRLANGDVVDRHIEHHGDGVAVLPYNPSTGRLMLVSMVRAAVLHRQPGDLLEVIAGGLHQESPPDCARREALEEAGVALGELERIGALWSMPQVSTDVIHLYLAPYNDGDRVTAGGGVKEEQEDIAVHELSAREAWRLYEAGALIDMKAVVLLQALRLAHPEVFEK